MFLTSYIFKSKAVRSLKGNWQTALIVSFIAALPATVKQFPLLAKPDCELSHERLEAVQLAFLKKKFAVRGQSYTPGTPFKK